MDEETTKEPPSFYTAAACSILLLEDSPPDARTKGGAAELSPHTPKRGSTCTLRTSERWHLILYPGRWVDQRPIPKGDPVQLENTSKVSKTQILSTKRYR